MKSSDIIFYDPHHATGQVLYMEEDYGCAFLPVTRRERGSRWGHGNRTIGGYKRYSRPGPFSDRTLTEVNQWVGRWVWEWVDPRNIQRTMAQVFEANAAALVRAQQEQERVKARRKQVKDQFEATGLGFDSVMNILGYGDDTYQRRMLLRGERTTLYLTPEDLVKLIIEAQMAVPEVRHAKLQAEVEAALNLLGG